MKNLSIIACVLLMSSLNGMKESNDIVTDKLKCVDIMLKHCECPKNISFSADVLQWSRGAWENTGIKISYEKEKEKFIYSKLSEKTATEISILIPLYNNIPYNKELVQYSCKAALNYNGHVKIIFGIDDESSNKQKELDSLAEHLRKIELNDNVKIEALVADKNNGVNVMRILLLSRLKMTTLSPYILMFDADDIIHPDCLNISMQFLKEHKDIDMIYGEYVSRMFFEKDFDKYKEIEAVKKAFNKVLEDSTPISQYYTEEVVSRSVEELSRININDAKNVLPIKLQKNNFCIKILPSNIYADSDSDCFLKNFDMSDGYRIKNSPLAFPFVIARLKDETVLDRTIDLMMSYDDDSLNDFTISFKNRAYLDYSDETKKYPLYLYRYRSDSLSHSLPH